MRHITKYILASALTTTLTLAGNLPGYKALCDQLGNLKGWEVSKCDGMKMTNPMFGEVVTANKNYTHKGQSLNVNIVSGMQAMMMWAPFATGTQIENDENLIKLEKIDGFDVGISHNKKEHSGTIAVLLAPNAVMGIEYDGMDWKEALKEAKKLNWKKLRSLFQ